VGGGVPLRGGVKGGVRARRRHGELSVGETGAGTFKVTVTVTVTQTGTGGKRGE
jgi:hypothetical protein